MIIADRPRHSQAPSERHITALGSFNWFKNVTLVVRNLMSSQKFQILLLKWLPPMAILLVANVIDHRHLNVNAKQKTRQILPATKNGSQSIAVR